MARTIKIMRSSADSDMVFPRYMAWNSIDEQALGMCMALASIPNIKGRKGKRGRV